MAGHKKLWAAHATYDAVGEEQILEWRASGHSVRKVCALAQGTTRQLYHWLDNGVGHDQPLEGWSEPTRRERWNRANVLCAEAIADGGAAKIEALRDPDTGRMKPDVTREEIAFTKIDTDYDKWRASVMDPDTFGDKRGQTTVSIGALHLNALREVTKDLKALPSDVVDVPYEEVSHAPVDA